jgi:hypothetical protein
VKLTPRSQGFRFRKKHWPQGEWYYIRRVGPKFVTGYDQDGNLFQLPRREEDSSWIKIKKAVDDES